MSGLDAGIRKAAQYAASRIKSSEYRLDPDLPVASVVGISSRRSLGILRGLIRGVGLRKSPWSALCVGRGVSLRNRRMIKVGKGVTAGRGAVLDGLSRRGLVLGDNVTIGPYSIIETSGVITDLGEGCVMGARSAIGSHSFIGAAGGVWIGEDVIMGNRVSFHSENHVFEDTSRPIRDQGVTREGITIDDDCWVGANVTFLDGARVGRGCVIAAGSVVRGEIPPMSVIAGVPAKVMKMRERAELYESPARGAAVGVVAGGVDKQCSGLDGLQASGPRPERTG
ncbi:DapH/DapD/GlmU-related protein [Streptomyces sp. NPDC006971]|uniref:acyltransferase n=1 Tax=Streptomyces sp. NPDC006971 TaxID=3154784 RepID=UPI0033C6CDF2